MHIEAKDISISSLALRFYFKSGWSLEFLNQYLKKGSFVTDDHSGISTEPSSYYVLDAGSTLDVDRLYAEGHVGTLVGKERWPELAAKTDLEVLQDRNW